MASVASLSFPVPAARTAWHRRTLPGGLLPALLAAWLAGDAVLLWRFLGIGGAALTAGGAGAAIAIGLGMARAVRGGRAGPSLGTLLACLGLAAVLLLLGGEGRLFYANLDWQVRDAVLRDMAVHPWPFVYASDSGPQLLRAPIGLYLVPALAAKLWGQGGGDAALLVQNTLLLGAMLAAAAPLFAGRARIVAAAVFLGFSGLDLFGMAIAHGWASLRLVTHVEDYAALEYSSTVTLAFWVPQHAIAGWLGALAFLLWREGTLRIGGLAAVVPLAALWSPLGALGVVPFLAYAALVELRRGGVRLADIGLPAGAALLAMPALLYLAAAPEAVGLHRADLDWGQYLGFELIDAVPLLLLAAAAPRARFAGWPLAIVAACLVAMPWLQIGWSIDFEMRASITPLALLAVHLADCLAGMRADAALAGRQRAILLALLLAGAATPLTEIAGALLLPASPVPRCGFAKAWDQTFARYPKGSYLAPLARVPAGIRPAAPAVVADADPPACYDRPWPGRRPVLQSTQSSPISR